MYNVLIIIHTMVTFALIAIILMQRNSSDGMGLSGGSSNSFMSGRAAASFITRATAALAALFILLSLVIGIVTIHNHENSGSLLDKIENGQAAPAAKPETAPLKQEPAKQEPVKPGQPAVPRPE